VSDEERAPGTHRTCDCGAEVFRSDPEALVALEAVTCSDCGREHLFTGFIKMDVALTEACNYACVHCRRPSDPLILKKPEVLRVLADAAAIGLDTVSFCGGEPFMHRDFVEIAQEAIRRSLKVQMVTHGGFVTRERVEQLRGLDCLTVSIDGPPKIHEQIRQAPDSWRKAADALVLAGEADIPTGVNTVIQRDNAEHLWHNFEALMDHTSGRLDYFRHAPVEVVPETAELQIEERQLPAVLEQLTRIAAVCDEQDVFFVHRTQMLEHLPRFIDKWKRHRPLGGCRIPRRFIGYSKLGFYLCWHQGTAIQASSLTEALRSERAAAIVAEAAAGGCVGCNALTYSWDEEWNAGILAGQLFDDGQLPDQKTTVEQDGSAWTHESRASLNILR
jgi:sulfatase maturation enzyme AslB (radical SAM superfamily)